MPLIHRPSFSSDIDVIAIIDKKKKKKKKKGGLFNWLSGGKKCEAVSIRDVTEPWRFIQRRPSASSFRTRITIDDDNDSDVTMIVCVRCRTQHYSSCIPSPSYSGCCRCIGDGRSLCEYQYRYRHRHGHHHRSRDRSHEGCAHETSRYRQSHHHHHHRDPYNIYSQGHRSRGRSFPHLSPSTSSSEEELLVCSNGRGSCPRHLPPIRCPGTYPAYRLPSSYGDYRAWQRSQTYLNSNEHSWREELTDLMAENREESAWERHNNCIVMPEFEKGGFICKDSQERADRIAHLEDLLEESRRAGLEGEKGAWEGRIGL